MQATAESSDAGLIDLLRRRGPLGISQMASAMGVTATAVRQRLSRLVGAGLLRREINKTVRGRPSHRYLLTDKAMRGAGSNFADLVVALWKEIREVKDVSVRSGLLRRLAQSMAKMYGGRVRGESTADRMQAVSELLADRNIPFVVDRSKQLPVLTALACPYPDLAEQDRGICAVEKMLFSELLGEKVQLTECRLDGGSDCCRFETKGQTAASIDSSELMGIVSDSDL